MRREEINMINIVRAGEAINRAKVISSYEQLSNFCVARLFMVFKRSEDRRAGKESRSRWLPYH